MKQAMARRSLALCMGVSPSSIVRLRVFELGESGGQAPSEIEVELEVSLGTELLNETQVSASLRDLEDASSPTSLLFRNMMKAYFDAQVMWVELVMSPLTYSGSLRNFTGIGIDVTSIEAEAEDPESRISSPVAGVVLSMAVVPIVAALVRLIRAERNGDLGPGSVERKGSRGKRKVKSGRFSGGPAALDSG